MNKPEIIFALVNGLALIGWLLLVFLPHGGWTSRLVHAGLIPGLLAASYTVLIMTTFGRAEGGFGSLADVMKLFRYEWAVLTGWIHYLAFDLFVGAWELRDSQRAGIVHWKVVPCLVHDFSAWPDRAICLSSLASLWGRQKYGGTIVDARKKGGDLGSRWHHHRFGSAPLGGMESLDGSGELLDDIRGICLRFWEAER